MGGGFYIDWVEDSGFNLGFEASNMRVHQYVHLFSCLYSKDIELGTTKVPSITEVPWYSDNIICWNHVISSIFYNHDSTGE